MKIFNLILLNLCFLELFSLLSGMNPGQGPSGSQGPEVLFYIFECKYKYFE